MYLFVSDCIIGEKAFDSLSETRPLWGVSFLSSMAALPFKLRWQILFVSSPFGVVRSSASPALIKPGSPAGEVGSPAMRLSAAVDARA